MTDFDLERIGINQVEENGASKEGEEVRVVILEAREKEGSIRKTYNDLVGKGSGVDQ